jgi:light-harvesting protein B-800-850 alpha chain
MNQGKVWLFVRPGFGIPFFLSMVVFASLSVHYAVLTHTKWYPAFYEGGKKTPAP